MARETDAYIYSVHLRTSVVQLFHHSFGFKVTILMVKSVKTKSLFLSLGEVIETIIFTG